jgi:hypothetical protein
MLNTKKFLATTFALAMAIVLITGIAQGVKNLRPGYPPYDDVPGKLFNFAGLDPYAGYYSGYWAMFDVIFPDLLTLGFASERVIAGGDWDFWDIIWDAGCRYSSQDENPAIIKDAKGWDLTAFNWWLMPTGMLWNDAVILEEAIYPVGYNVWPYLSSYSDELYWLMQSSFDALDRKGFANAWQAELMHNPPAAVVYYGESYDIHASYMEGYYGTVWWYDIRNWHFDQTLIDTLYPGYMSLTEYNRLKNGTLKYGVTDDWWSFNPIFCDTYTEETFANLIGDTLYGMSLSVWPAPETPADSTKFCTDPVLADGMPKFPVDDTHAVINLKTGITWSDGEAFNADDVVYTLNLHLDHTVGTTARGDFAPIVNSVTKINDTAVELELHRPYVDLEDILSNSWGCNILPEHYFSSIPPGSLKGHVSNTDAATSMLTPTIGAYNLTSFTVDSLTYEKNPKYWGYGAPYNYGPYGIDKIILDQIKDETTRWNALLNHEIDLCEYPTKPVDDFIPLLTRPDLDVFAYGSPASNSVWFNFDNPYLSNRYVRLAIAHVINYDFIGTNILPSWGYTAYVEGRSPLVEPGQWYDDGTNLVHLFDDTLVPYEYDMVKAAQYFDCWKLSRIAHANFTSGDWTRANGGAVGDGDFSGVVNIDDFIAWTTQWAMSEADFSWDGPYECLPGQDKDSDYNNDDVVNTDDFTLWAANYGAEYPFPGAY